MSMALKPSPYGAISFGLMFESPSPEKDGSPAGQEDASASTSSSSIGKNSDAGEENDEAQSSYKGPLDMMDALEDVLPIRRGISRFYNYKSKSFTSLANASTTSSVQEIAKPDHLYTRKRRNLLASSLIWDKNRSFHWRGRAGIAKSSKKTTLTASRSTLALAVAMSSAETSPSSSDDSDLRSPTSPFPSSKANGTHAAWRSLSLADLQECAAVNTTTSRFFPSKLKLHN